MIRAQCRNMLWMFERKKNKYKTWGSVFWEGQGRNRDRQVSNLHELAQTNTFNKSQFWLLFVQWLCKIYVCSLRQIPWNNFLLKPPGNASHGKITQHISLSYILGQTEFTTVFHQDKWSVCVLCPVWVCVLENQTKKNRSQWFLYQFFRHCI